MLAYKCCSTLLAAVNAQLIMFFFFFFFFFIVKFLDFLHLKDSGSKMKLCSWVCDRPSHYII